MSMTRLCFLALLAIALAACQRQPPQAPAPTTRPSGTADATAPRASPGREPRADEFDSSTLTRDTTPVDAKLVNVRLSSQGDTGTNTIGMPTSVFARTDTVYAEIQTSGTAGHYTLYAKWRAADGTALSDYGVEINEAGPKRTVISLSKPDGWSPGTSSIELAINGKIERTVSFKVQ